MREQSCLYSTGQVLSVAAAVDREQGSLVKFCVSLFDGVAIPVDNTGLRLFSGGVAGEVCLTVRIHPVLLCIV